MTPPDATTLNVQPRQRRDVYGWLASAPDGGSVKTILSEHDIIWYRDHYTPDPGIRPDPLVSPMLAPDLTGLAPTYIATGGFDPLRDDGNEYADALKSAGVAVTHICHPSLTHGFVNLLAVPGAVQEARAHLTDHLRATLY